MERTLALNTSFDIDFDEYGDIETVTFPQSIMYEIWLDFTLNKDWVLDKRLGMPWITADGKGLLQGKSNDTLVASVVRNKLIANPYVKDIKVINIKHGLDRSASMEAVVILIDDTEVALSYGGKK